MNKTSIYAKKLLRIHVKTLQNLQVKSDTKTEKNNKQLQVLKVFVRGLQGKRRQLQGIILGMLEKLLLNFLSGSPMKSK